MGKKKPASSSHVSSLWGVKVPKNVADSASWSGPGDLPEDELLSGNYSHSDTPDRPITNRESLARQKALRALRKGLTPGAISEQDRLGKGLWSEVYDIPGEDYVLKRPVIANDDFRDLVSEADFWDDIRHKARVDAVLGEDIAEPTFAIKTSKGEYGIQRRTDEMIDEFVDRLEKSSDPGSMAKGLKSRIDHNLARRKQMDRMSRIEDKLFEADLMLDRKERDLRTMMKRRDTNLNDIVKQQEDIIKQQKIHDRLQRRLNKAEAVYHGSSNPKQFGSRARKLGNRRVDELRKKIREKGVISRDLHAANIGHDRKKKVAKAIDTGLFGVPKLIPAEDGGKKFNPSVVDYNKAGSSRIITKKLPKISKYLKQVPLIGPLIGGAALLGAPTADAKQEVAGEFIGSSGLSDPRELAFEKDRHKERRFKRLLDILRKQELDDRGGIPYRID